MPIALFAARRSGRPPLIVAAFHIVCVVVVTRARGIAPSRGRRPPFQRCHSAPRWDDDRIIIVVAFLVVIASDALRSNGLSRSALAATAAAAAARGPLLSIRGCLCAWPSNDRRCAFILIVLVVDIPITTNHERRGILRAASRARSAPPPRRLRAGP
ncbi:MAG: hypothetical protein M3Z37_08495, partial [Candidatus Eremiobacteraeota bacterium]|nr:hypothetical protein [Candidatus Eremiobacteraeota bacterium]